MPAGADMGGELAAGDSDDNPLDALRDCAVLLRGGEAASPGGSVDLEAVARAIEAASRKVESQLAEQ